MFSSGLISMMSGFDLIQSCFLFLLMVVCFPVFDLFGGLRSFVFRAIDVRFGYFTALNCALFQLLVFLLVVFALGLAAGAQWDNASLNLLLKS